MNLRAENLAAKRGDDLLFVNVSFSLDAGEALVLTGPNGSGKSTLLRVIAGLLEPEEGHAIFTSPAGESNRRVGEVSHYLGHRNAMKSELTVVENLSFWKSFLGDAKGGKGMAIAEAADAVGLRGIIHLPFGYLSAGQQRRMAFAKLLVAYRPVWILDEPTAALDASADRLFAQLISNHQKAGGIVFAATHQPLGLQAKRALDMSDFRAPW